MASTSTEAAAAMDELAVSRRNIINRLRRLEGQIRGLQSMIEAQKECEAVLTQVMAAKSALDKVGLHIIRHAMHECLLEDETKGRDELVDEALDIFLKYVNCVR